MRQLIFTSALAGLAPGRSGFCTVARHASLRERTVAELERMSVYEPPAGTRPTVFLFRSYSGGSERLYILTRAGDAGTDDFGRPNSVVHHLIFRESEIAALLPPAEIALRFRGWCEKFSGPPRFLDDDDEALPSEILRGNAETLLPAKRWEALTGDAGNAALLCPRGDARATVFLGDESMTETVLGLFAESSETLGAENAWEIAFSTGICSARGAGRFLWRMVEEREVSVRRPGDFILDFLAPLALLRAPETAFAEYARTGKRPEPSARGFSERKGADPVPAPVAPEAPHVPAAPDSSGVPSPEPPRSASGNADEDLCPKRFADIAGTAKFLGISAALTAAVLAAATFLTFSGGEKSAENGVNAESVAERAVAARRADPVAAYRAALDARVEDGDFAGAAEVWSAFSEAFPQEAERLRGSALPRFKLKVAGAFAERISRRLIAADLGGEISPETRRLVAADLAMFDRVCRELELTPGRLQKRNLAVFDRARALIAEPEEATSEAPEADAGDEEKSHPTEPAS